MVNCPRKNQLFFSVGRPGDWVEQRETFKPRSRLALRQELGQKGVERSIIEMVLADVDETAVARAAAAKQAQRFTNLPEDEFRAKIGRFLQRRGFNYEIVRQITEETWHTIQENIEPESL